MRKALNQNQKNPRPCTLNATSTTYYYTKPSHGAHAWLTSLCTVNKAWNLTFESECVINSITLVFPCNLSTALIG